MTLRRVLVIVVLHNLYLPAVEGSVLDHEDRRLELTRCRGHRSIAGVCHQDESQQRGTNVKQSLGAKTLLYPTPVLVVGSYHADGRPNVMTAAWGGIACSKPPCVSVSLRAATATHGNIVARKAFTISLPSGAQAAAADYFGLVSGRKTDKFAATGLTPVRAEFVDAPCVAEFPLVVECAVVQ